MSDSVRELCDRARAGDLSAASELVAFFYQPVYAFLRRLCGSNEDAEDLTQKTFAKVWASLGSYGGRSNFSTWIHGIGYHVYVDWRRQKNPTEPRADEWWETRAAEGASPFEDAAERELARQLFALVEQLDERMRDVVHLHYYQGLSIQETADVLKVATSTVKYRMREALNWLKSRAVEPKI